MVNRTIVFWAARNIRNRASNFNHHFVLILLSSDFSLLQTPARVYNGQKFVTLGAFPSDQNNMFDLGNLIFEPNDGFDARAAELFLSAAPSADDLETFDPQQNIVSPPNGNVQYFARHLEDLAYRYRRNTERNAVAYRRLGPNSNSWVNSLFKYAGVPLEQRMRCRAFDGWDVAEEVVISESRFR